MEDKDLIEREKTNNCKILMGRINCSYAKSECMLKNECSTCLFQPFRNAIEEYNGYIASKQGHRLLCPIHYIENAMDTCKGCIWYDICTTGIGRVK